MADDGPDPSGSPDGAPDRGQVAASNVAGGGADAFAEDYWFDEEEAVTIPRGRPLLLALSGAGVYATSFVFAAVGLQFVAASAAETYAEHVLGAVFFLPIPIAAFVGAGIALELLFARGDGLPETTIPLALLIPILLHVSLFFVESVNIGYTRATLADLFARDPVLSQLLLWPPVIAGTVFAVVVHQATTTDRSDGVAGSPFDIG